MERMMAQECANRQALVPVRGKVFDVCWQAMIVTPQTRSSA
jgi:hypothetical protein